MCAPIPSSRLTSFTALVVRTLCRLLRRIRGRHRGSHVQEAAQAAEPAHRLVESLQVQEDMQWQCIDLALGDACRLHELDGNVGSGGRERIPHRRSHLRLPIERYDVRVGVAEAEAVQFYRGLCRRLCRFRLDDQILEDRLEEDILSEVLRAGVEYSLCGVGYPRELLEEEQRDILSC